MVDEFVQIVMKTGWGRGGDSRAVGNKDVRVHEKFTV